MEPQVVERVQHDWESGTELSMTVVDAVAEGAGEDPSSLPPLYECIDPDALETLFSPRRDTGITSGSASFEFAGHPVEVHASGEVVVYSG